MSNSFLRSRLARDARQYPIVAVGPYVVLALLVAFTVIDKTVIDRRDAEGSLIANLALCALAAAWMLWMFTLHPAWQERPPLMAVFLAGLIVAIVVLVVGDGVLAIAGYIYVFALIPSPWQLLGVSAVAVVARTAQSSGIAKDTPFGLATSLLIIAVNVLAICGLASIYQSSIEQSNQRRRALDEVSAANRHHRAASGRRAGGGRTECAAPAFRWRCRLARQSLSEARRGEARHARRGRSVNALRPEPLPDG